MTLDVWTMSERRALLLSVGGGHLDRPLSPVEVGRLFAKARAGGNSSREIAESLHLDSAAMIGRFLSLTKLPLQVQETVGWGRNKGSINLTQAQEVARLSSALEQTFLAEAVVENGLSSGEVRAVVQLVRNAGQPVAKAVQSTLAMRPTVERRYVAICTIHDESLRMFLSTLSNATRRNLLREALPFEVESCSLSSTHFTLATGEQVSDIEEIETTVNAALLARIQ